MPRHVLNTELCEFNIEPEVTCRYVYETDSDWNPVHDHFYSSDDCPIFLKKKKSQIGTPYLVSWHWGTWPKGMITWILHLLGGCPTLKGIKHSSLQLSSWHRATAQTGTQKHRPENKRSLTAQRTELGKSWQDYKYFTLESEPINRSNPLLQLSTLGY